MGHIRLGTLPRTRKWIEVLDLVGGGGGSPQVAAATLDASKHGLAKAADDPGLVRSFWLLTQMPLAARSGEFAARLQPLGVRIGKAPTLLEVVGGVATAVDEHVRQIGGRTDLGEMAQMAACETLVALGAPLNASLFQSSAPTVEDTLKSFSTPKEFARLAREFFARLSRKYVSYFLSRELSNYVAGDGRFRNVEEHTEFNRELDLYCRQAARIVEEFSGGWFSKTNFEGGIAPEDAARFLHVALKKLRGEFAREEASHGE